MAENILTIKRYFEKEVFVIPNYQRGYKWGVPEKDGTCAVSFLLDSFIKAFKSNDNEYFIQGVTVYENDNKVYLVDGQQRTTTIFLLLKYLQYPEISKVKLAYEIREKSEEFLNSADLLTNIAIDNSDFQDIFYFKKAIRTFNDKFINEKNKSDFLKFVLTKVKLFYIEIDKNQATSVFSMMNGNKAVMFDEELIKASILSKASRYEIKDNELNESKEWEINSLRNRYAREWDKWMYWWNQDDVKAFWGTGNKPITIWLIQKMRKTQNTHSKRLMTYFCKTLKKQN
jgi:hypothetical protein